MLWRGRGPPVRPPCVCAPRPPSTRWSRYILSHHPPSPLTLTTLPLPLVFNPTPTPNNVPRPSQTLPKPHPTMQLTARGRGGFRQRPCRVLLVRAASSRHCACKAAWLILGRRRPHSTARGTEFNRVAPRARHHELLLCSCVCALECEAPYGTPEVREPPTLTGERGGEERRRRRTPSWVCLRRSRRQRTPTN